MRRINKKIESINYSEVTNTTYIKFTYNMEGIKGLYSRTRDYVGKKTLIECERLIK